MFLQILRICMILFQECFPCCENVSSIFTRLEHMRTPEMLRKKNSELKDIREMTESEKMCLTFHDTLSS